MLLNKSEKLVKSLLETLGYQVVKPAWPDLLVWNEKKNEVKFIEVKFGGDRLSRQQAETITLLNELGFHAEILVFNETTLGYKIYKEIKAELKRTKKRDRRVVKNKVVSDYEEIEFLKKLTIKTEKEELEEILNILPKGGEEKGST